ncbi:MAG: alpha-L-fucosidase [Nitrososphaerota archaeon]|nr:alpha-L-fucosidase [Candidatus Bathyarchaeota archaeon]MDW8048342.1 alpha-L-fucosidase [Nitrososphaerota archaeon]
MEICGIQIPEGPFKPDWESLKQYTVPKWYLDAKFGIFIHWGVYSVPAFQNEWYPRNMYLIDQPAFKHHIKTYGPQKVFGYKDFINLFKAERWEPKEWAELFSRAGARYVVPVAEHHDGFAMYDSSYTEWNAARMGPMRDVIGELASAVRNEGLVFGVSYHRAEHWWFFEGGMQFESDVKDPRYHSLYGPAQPKSTQPDKDFLEDWLRRACELVDKYRPQIFWFDWWIEQPAFEPYLRAFAAYYYNKAAQWKLGVVINYKHNAFPEQAAILDIERGKLDDIREMFWQTDTSICRRSWGYIRDHNYKSADQIIDDLVDAVSKNGSMLLNIAPKPDGTIPEEQQRILLEIGKWLEINGEAIYGTRPWRVYGEGPTKTIPGEFKEKEQMPFTGRDIRFTRKDDVLYAIALAWPGEELIVKSLSTDLRLLRGEIESVHLLGSDKPVEWTRDSSGLRVKLPKNKPCEYAVTVKIILKET